MLYWKYLLIKKNNFFLNNKIYFYKKKKQSFTIEKKNSIEKIIKESSEKLFQMVYQNIYKKNSHKLFSLEYTKEEAYLETEVLLSHILNINVNQLVCYKNKLLNEKQMEEFNR